MAAEADEETKEVPLAQLLVREWAQVGRRVRFQLMRLGRQLPPGGVHCREIQETVRQIDALLAQVNAHVKGEANAD